jgi:nucleoside-diphosphate kinase
MERTLVLLKPDAVERRLVGAILARFERKGLDLAGLKMIRLSAAQAARHYAEHRGRDFYAPLVRFLSSGPIVAVALEGRDAVRVVRQMVGPTFSGEAAPGTIRGDFGLSRRFNLIHASDSVRTARRELAAFFDKRDLVQRRPTDAAWVYDLTGPEPV